MFFTSSEGRSNLSVDGRKRQIASSFTTRIVESMVDMPERTAMILIEGRDGEGRMFYVLTPPFWDFTMFDEQEQQEENREVYWIPHMISHNLFQRQKIITWNKLIIDEPRARQNTGQYNENDRET